MPINRKTVLQQNQQFQLIMTEFSQYGVLKEAVRAKLTSQPSRPNVEKIKKDISSKRGTKVSEKKILTAGSNI